jgi:hypothetical protein
MVMKLTSLTAVFIARDFCAPIETARALAERVVDVNIIIVANGAGSVTPMPSQTKILTGSPSRSRPPRLFRCSNISGQLPVRR